MLVRQQAAAVAALLAAVSQAASREASHVAHAACALIGVCVAVRCTGTSNVTGYAPRGVTHDDLYLLLPRYAAGELDEVQAFVVRDHLATGCPECLAAVFRPSGSNGPAPGASVERAVLAEAPAPRRPSRRLVYALGFLAMLFAASTGWMFRLLASREQERRVEAEQEAARVTELAQARATVARLREELEAQATAATTARAAIEAEAQRQVEAARAGVEDSAELVRRLESAEARVAELTRGIRNREREIARLLAGAEIRALGDLAATPGVQVLRLVPGPVAEDARGHVLWHPARERIVLYVFDLPDGRYRVRLRLDDGVVLTSGDLRLGTHGEAATAIELGVRAARLRAVWVSRDPGEDRVLEARLPGPG